MALTRSLGAPLGPGGTWKTGQRTPQSGYWRDQYGEMSFFTVHTTFPPCIGRKGECAYRTFVGASRTVTS